MPPAPVEYGPGTWREALLCKLETSEENFLFHTKLQCSHPLLHVPKPFRAHRILFCGLNDCSKSHKACLPSAQREEVRYASAPSRTCSLCLPIAHLEMISAPSALCFLPSSRDLGCEHASLQLSSLSMCFTAYLEACTIRVWHWEALASPPFSMLAQHAGRSRRPWQRPP